MRKRISGYIFGSIRPTWLAWLLGQMVNCALDLAYWGSKRLHEYNESQANQLPCYAEARALLKSVSPKPQVERPVRSSACDSDIAISVIVPVYNVELYVGRCLDSLNAQLGVIPTEIIVVDDGSTDESGRIVDDYRSDSRFRVVHQCNQGFSGARNTGLELARGRYICFVDSDDYVEPTFLQTMYTAIEKEDADIVEVGYYKLFEDGTTKQMLHPAVSLHNDATGVIFQYPGLFWGKLYRRELFENIRLPEGYWYEDTIVHFLLFRMCEAFVYLPQPLYAYRVNEKGITKSSVGNPKAIDSYWILEYCLDMSDQLQLERNDVFYGQLLYHCGFILWSRVKALPEDVQMAAFVLAAKLVEDNRISVRRELKYLYREVEDALLQRNFAKWCLASKYM